MKARRLPNRAYLGEFKQSWGNKLSLEPAFAVAPHGPKLIEKLRNRLLIIYISVTQRNAQAGLHAYFPPRLKGNIDPFSFFRTLPPLGVIVPDFKIQLGSAASFSRPDVPPWSAEPMVAVFLAELALRMRARSIVEVGSFLGWTSAHLALALHETRGRLHCVECDARFLEIARSNLVQRVFESQVEFHCGLSTDEQVLTKLPS